MNKIKALIRVQLLKVYPELTNNGRLEDEIDYHYRAWKLSNQTGKTLDIKTLPWRLE